MTDDTTAYVPAEIHVTERGTRWSMGRRDGVVTLAWSYPHGGGVLNGSTQWASVEDIPNGFDPAATVDRDRARAEASSTQMVGQTSRARRWVLPSGWTLYLHRYGGPPTWWFPRLGVRVGRTTEIRAGWLRSAFAVALTASTEEDRDE